MKLLRCPPSICRVLRRLQSHLVAVGDQGESKVLVFKPALDIDATLSNSNVLAENLARRGISSDRKSAENTVSSLMQSWRVLLQEKDAIREMEAERLALRERMQSAGDAVDPALQQEVNRVSSAISARKKKSWDAERSLMPLLIHLPNGLHERTPDEPQQILENFCVANPWQKVLGGGVSYHACQRKTNPSGHRFLLGDAAVAELEMLQHCRDELGARGFRCIAPPDTVTPPVAEACYGPAAVSRSPSTSSPSEVVRVKNDDLYLPGSASLAGMCSLFARRATRPEVALPMKLYSTGTVYGPGSEQTGCGVLVLMSDRGADDQERQFQEAERSVVDLAAGFGCNCRTVAVPASKLAPRQRHKTEVQILCGNSHWEPVGFVEDSSDYLSRRMLLKYQKRGDPGDYFLRVVYGFVSITRIILCYVDD